MSDGSRKTNDQRIREEMRAGARELGVDLEVGRIPDEDLPQGRTRMTGEGDRVDARVEDEDDAAVEDERRMTKEEQILKRIREAGVEAYKIPDERLPQGRTQITFFGEAKRVPRPGDRVEVRVEDGGWRAGYRAISEPVDASTIPLEQRTAAGVNAELTVVWITDEERWKLASEDERASLPGMPWPATQLRPASD